MHLEQELFVGKIKKEAAAGAEKCALEWHQRAKSCWGTNELFNLIVFIYFSNF